MRRVLLVGGVLLASLSVVGYLGIQGIQAAIRWLHEQPQYRVRFQDIVLVDPPPAWFRGGAEGLLKQVQQVRESSGKDEAIRLLDIKRAIDIKENPIARDFLESPWVEEVKRIEYPPYGIRVQLAYKTPVAEMPLGRGERIILDRSGALLPLEDIDPGRLGPPIKILGSGLTPSPGNRPGKPWKSAAAGAAGAKLERTVADAARLAGFFLEPERARQATASDALRILSIVATDPQDRGLFIQNADHTMILWGNAPGTEIGSEPDAEEKWEILRKWSRNSGIATLPPGDYWAFRRSELKQVQTNQTIPR
jgi:hypothetical protein